MDVIDYATLIEQRAAQYQSSVHDVVICDDAGFRRRHQGSRFENFQEIVRLSDDAFLLATCCEPTGEPDRHRQIVRGGDWVHIQFRLHGGGVETIESQEPTLTPAKSCIISRYPGGAVISREIPVEQRWQFACLYISPKSLRALLDAQASALPEPAQWIAADASRDFQATTIPIEPSMAITVKDIFNCSFTGLNRRIYMRGKALELIALTMNALGRDVSGSDSGLTLSRADIAKIVIARKLMEEDFESNLTLAQLAKRIGLNRTKLALGFKKVHGSSVQAFWRDARLAWARDELIRGNICVTEAAFSVGYSELSSFTRAFARKYGQLPRDCRKLGRSNVSTYPG